MGPAGFGERRLWIGRTVAACLIATTVALAIGCTSGEVPGEQEGPDEATTAVPFSGRLVYTDGTDIIALNGQTGEATRMGPVEGEIGFSGFAELTAEGEVIYESLDGADSRLLLAGDGAASRVLATGISLLHHFSDDTVLATDDDDTFTVASTASEPRRLGVGPSLDGILSADRSEFAYVVAVPSEDVTASAGEPAQAAFVRALDGTGAGQQVAEGSFAIAPLALDAGAFLYAAYPFGGHETADLVLHDRRSGEATTVASGVRILDSSPHLGLVAVQSASDGRVSIVDTSDPAAVTVTTFEQGPSGDAGWARLTTNGDGLIVSFVENGSAVLVHYETADRTSRQLARFDGETITQVLLHPAAPVGFVVVEGDAGASGVPERSVAICDLSDGTVERLADTSGASLRLIGIAD